MSKKITQEDVKYIASLSRIYLQDDELEPLTKNLEDILGYIKKLSNLDTSDALPTSHVCAMDNVFREDQVQPSLPQNEALKIAVEQTQGSFKVPKVIE
ncbi:MAG: Asp-tRNA(Asn)/Glu-tRNA(Gln) amidotransferase subunit GatC [Candidatus Omnitrophica bacterium]|nr:Asp-tRNA(Asn)/Glu-tRNA(Gln) amidotransferase subunit GatC [Candidatus Omnitrophota bacterium]